MKMRTRTITVTAVMIALCIAVQFFKVPTFAYSVYVIGGLINLILIIDTLYCGIVSGIIVSAVAPITSFIITGSPVIAAVPMILPCIMIGNMVLVLFAWFVRCKKLELNLLPISLIAGSVAKWGVMTLLIIRWVLPSSYIFHNPVNCGIVWNCISLCYLAYCAIRCKTFKIKIVYG